MKVVGQQCRLRDETLQLQLQDKVERPHFQQSGMQPQVHANRLLHLQVPVGRPIRSALNA
jgi:hypothetical protein